MTSLNITEYISKSSRICNLVSMLAGALIPLGFAPFNIWPLSILGIAILSLLINRQGLKVVMWRSWIFAVGMYGVGVSWIYVSISGFGGAPIPLAILLVALFVLFMACLFVIPFYLFGRWFSYHSLSLVAALPATWLLSEWLRTWLFTGFPWLFIGYSHLHTWLSGWAPITGVMGLSLITVLSATLIAELLFTSRKNRWHILFTIIVCSCWASGYFLQKIEWTTISTKPISLAIVQPNIAQEDKWQTDFQEPTLDLLREQTNSLWNHKIIIWPEAAVPFIYSQALPFLNEMNRKAADNHVGLITGIIYDETLTHEDKDIYYNSVVAFGDAIGIYHKRRLVPFGEYVPFEWLRGLIEFFNLPTSIISLGPDDQHGLKIDDVLISPSVCYEVAYPDLVAKSAVGSQLLMSVSNLGWFGDSLGRHQFMEMAQMRALETRHFYAYSTNNGPSAVFDPYGKIIVQTKAFEQATLDSTIFAANGSTPFMRWGSRPVVSIAFLIMLGLAISLARQNILSKKKNMQNNYEVR